jgi:hypothetical protein
MTPLYLALMGLDPATGTAEVRPDAGVDFLGRVHSGEKNNENISSPAVRNWVLSLASSIVHLLQKPAASIVASYPQADLTETTDETTDGSSLNPPGEASKPPLSSSPPADVDWAAHESPHHYPEAHRPRHATPRRPSAGLIPPAPIPGTRRRSLRPDDGSGMAMPILTSSVDDSAVPYTYGAEKTNFNGPDPATLAAFLHYNYPSFSMVHVPAKDHTDITLATRAPLKVQCIVRCRIPTEDDRGTFYLHYYINNQDGEHHMAIVYGDDLKSASLEGERKGETDFDRVARGATLAR